MTNLLAKSKRRCLADAEAVDPVFTGEFGRRLQPKKMAIADRTGHRSSAMINAYRRLARTFEEFSLGDFGPLDLTIPELSLPRKGGQRGGS